MSEEACMADDNASASLAPQGSAIPPRSYKPYSKAYLETPLWSLILRPLCLDCIEPVLMRLYQLRAFIATPMSTKVIPRVIAKVLPNRIVFITVGDLILLVPLLVFFLRGLHYTFVSPALDLSGYMAASCLYYTFVTASKSNSPFSFFLGIPYERLIGLHWVSAFCAAFLSGCHGYVAYNYGGDDDGDSKYSKAVALSDETMEASWWKFLWDGRSNWSGTLLISSIMGMLLLSSFPILRRMFFNMWYYLHIVLGVTVLVTLFLHSVSSAVFVTFWWVFDLLIRYAVTTLQTKSRAKIRIIGGRKRQAMMPHEPAVELIIPKPPGFEYNPGQFVRIAVPAISAFEFHPISISSAPHEKNVVLHVRRLGDWTDKLVQLAEDRPHTTVLMEGPYGASSIGLEDDVKYKLVLCVSGGIGVTPCQSIGKDLLYSHRTQGRNLKQLRFVWAVRDLGMVRDIPPLLLAHYPDEDYSMASPLYQRMMDRSRSFRPNESSTSKTTDLVSDSDSVSENKDEEESAVKLQRRPATVQVDIYCTRSGEDDENIEEGELPYNLHKGRPDIDSIFENFKQEAISLGESNVAVIGCGPTALMADLQEACRKHSNSTLSCSGENVFFEMHKEHFEL